MDAQLFFNALIGMVAFLGGWVLNSLRDNIKGLQVIDSEIAAKVHHIEVLVAGNYVKRDDMDAKLDKLSIALFTKLDKIDSKLDSKADKE